MMMIVLMDGILINKFYINIILDKGFRLYIFYNLITIYNINSYIYF